MPKPVALAHDSERVGDAVNGLLDRRVSVRRLGRRHGASLKRAELSPIPAGSGALEKLGRIDAQLLGDARKRLEGQVLGARLDALHVLHRAPHADREGLLRPSTSSPQLGDPAAHVADQAFGSSRLAHDREDSYVCLSLNTKLWLGVTWQWGLMQIVLVVDDDASVRKAVRRELANAGFACIEAGGGIEGTALVQTNTCAAVLLDYQMPDGLGDHVLAELRKLEPHIPVIMFSSQVADPAIAARLVALGATCLCEKPSVQNAVAAVVAACRAGDGT